MSMAEPFTWFHKILRKAPLQPAHWSKQAGVMKMYAGYHDLPSQPEINLQLLQCFDTCACAQTTYLNSLKVHVEDFDAQNHAGSKDQQHHAQTCQRSGDRLALERPKELNDIRILALTGAIRPHDHQTWED